jgi:glycosyltransferase involved in cell wall biosynthesis
MTLSDLPLPPPGKTGWPWTEDSGIVTNTAPSGEGLRRISIVTPSFNQGNFLEETIRSVLLQAYPKLEYIVIDGGSTDDSVEIIRRYESHLAYWVSEKDAGQAHAINKGFKKATGEWVGWLNSDDFYLPGAFHTLMRVASETQAEWVAGSVRFVHEGEEHLDCTKAQRSSNQLIDWLLLKFHFHQPGAFWKRAVFERYGYLDEHMHYAFDWAFWCRLVASGARPHLIDYPVAGFRLHNESKTLTRWDRFCAENDAIIQGYLPRLNMAEKWAAERRRTSLVCTRLLHESRRLLADNQWQQLLRAVFATALSRPQVLAKRTPYLLLLQSLKASMKFSDRTGRVNLKQGHRDAEYLEPKSK